MIWEELLKIVQYNMVEDLKSLEAAFVIHKVNV